MRQAIVAKYHGPTNTRGSRIRVKCEARARIYGWNHALGMEENYRAAFLAFLAILKDLGWGGTWHIGGLPGGGYVAVNDTAIVGDLVVK